MISSFFKPIQEAFRPKEFFTSLIATSSYFLFAFFYFKWVLNFAEFHWPLSIALYLGLVYVNYLVLCRAKDRLGNTIKNQTRKKIEKVLRNETPPDIFSEDFTFDVQEKVSRMADAAKNPLPKDSNADPVATAKEYDQVHREYLARLRQAELNKSIYESGLNRRFSSDEKNMDKVSEKD